MVLVWKYSKRAIQSIPTWQGLDGFQHNFCILALWMKVASALEGLRNKPPTNKSRVCPCVHSNSNKSNLCIDWHRECSPSIVSTGQTFNSCTSRPDICQCLVVQTPMDNMSKYKPSIPMTHIACKAKLLSVVRFRDLWSHPWPGNWVAIGRTLKGLSQDPASLSFGQVVSWKPPFWTGKNFYEEFSIGTFWG